MAENNIPFLNRQKTESSQGHRRIVLEALAIAVLVHVLLVVLFRYTPPRSTAPITAHHSIRLVEDAEDAVLDRMDPCKGAVPSPEWSFQAIELFPQVRNAPAIATVRGNYPAPMEIRLPRYVRFAGTEESLTRYGMWQYTFPAASAVAPQQYPVAETPDGKQFILNYDLPGTTEVKSSTLIVLYNGDPVRSSLEQSCGNRTLDFAALKWALQQPLSGDSAEYRIIWNQEVAE